MRFIWKAAIILATDGFDGMAIPSLAINNISNKPTKTNWQRK